MKMREAGVRVSTCRLRGAGLLLGRPHEARRDVELAPILDDSACARFDEATEDHMLCLVYGDGLLKKRSPHFCYPFSLIEAEQPHIPLGTGEWGIETLEF